jgi:hypothetical protein
VRTTWVLLAAALALTVMLLSACGGSKDTNVEASLRDYLSTIDPQACLESGFCPKGVFPVGAGVPRVRENSCKKLGTVHTDTVVAAAVSFRCKNWVAEWRSTVRRGCARFRGCSREGASRCGGPSSIQHAAQGKSRGWRRKTLHGHALGQPRSSSLNRRIAPAESPVLRRVGNREQVV